MFAVEMVVRYLALDFKKYVDEDGCLTSVLYPSPLGIDSEPLDGD